MRCLQRQHGVELPQPRAPIGLPKIADGELYLVQKIRKPFARDLVHGA